MVENRIADLTNMTANAEIVRIFLDYDGTLAEFASSPDKVLPNRELISIVERLAAARGILAAVISGRRLADIRKLLPIQGLLLGGTYGIEMQLPDGRLRSALPFEQVRPTIARIIPSWTSLIRNYHGFHLEDKGWSIALHGRFAQKEDAEAVMSAAQQIVQEYAPDARFRLLKGERFMEYAPLAANKADAVRWVLDKMTPEDALVVYLGDDDKDEEAIRFLVQIGGFAVRIAENHADTCAQFNIQNPAQVRAWLNDLLAARKV